MSDLRFVLASQAKGKRVVDLDEAENVRPNVVKICCRFHAEATPSCVIDMRSGSWCCYGCGAHGHLFVADPIRLVESEQGVACG